MSNQNSASDKSIDNSGAKSKKNRRRLLGVGGLVVAGVALAATVGGAYYASDVNLQHNKVSTASWGLQVNGSTNPTVGLDIEGIAPGVADGDKITVTNTSDKLDQEISITGIQNLVANVHGLSAADAKDVLVKVSGTNGFSTGGFVPVTSLGNLPLKLGTAVHGTTTTIYVDVELDPSTTNTAFAGSSASFDLTVHAEQKH